MRVDDQKSRKDGHDYVSLTSSVFYFFSRFLCTGMKVYLASSMDFSDGTLNSGENSAFRCLDNSVKSVIIDLNNYKLRNNSCLQLVG